MFATIVGYIIIGVVIFIIAGFASFIMVKQYIDFISKEGVALVNFLSRFHLQRQVLICMIYKTNLGWMGYRGKWCHVARNKKSIRTAIEELKRDALSTTLSGKNKFKECIIYISSPGNCSSDYDANVIARILIDDITNWYHAYGYDETPNLNLISYLKTEEDSGLFIKIA